jgi:hypothetical protein
MDPRLHASNVRAEGRIRKPRWFPGCFRPEFLRVLVVCFQRALRLALVPSGKKPLTAEIAENFPEVTESFLAIRVWGKPEAAKLLACLELAQKLHHLPFRPVAIVFQAIKSLAIVAIPFSQE